MADSKIKVGKHRESGPPPRRLWNLWFLDMADQEARRFLNEASMAYVIEQFEELARQVDPAHPLGLSVDAVETFYELREKGGPLGKINFRGFYLIDRPRRAVIVIGAIKKENDGKTPRGTVIRMRGRARNYFSGVFG